MRTDVVLSLFLLCCVLWSQVYAASDTLSVGKKITRDSAGNLVSANQRFEVGFFEKGVKKYLGIWYHRLPGEKTVVWVANRDKPVEDSSAVFQIGKDGNIEVVGGTGASSQRYWFSELQVSSFTNKTVKLLDSGNLVLMDDDHSGNTSYHWQSFQNPTDTFLPGMNMDSESTLTSWINESDPGRGRFTFKLGGAGKFVVYKESQLHWTLDGQEQQAVSSNFLLFVNVALNVSTNGSKFFSTWKEYDEGQPHDFNMSRLVMDRGGELQFLKWEDDIWTKQWRGPANKCDIHNYCGNFSSCNGDWEPCKCLPGFSKLPWDNDYLGVGESQFPGCVRKSTSCFNKKDTFFLNLTNIKVGNPDRWNDTENEAECQSLCLNMCNDSHIQCQAYSYNTSKRGSLTCEIWTRDLPTLQEEHPDGRLLSILVNASDIAPTPNSCEPCGTNTIPYPLSTGPNCGDPTYNKFHCNLEGQVWFKTPRGNSYRVTGIHEADTRFYIQMDDSNRCEPGSSEQNDKPKSPFNVTNLCFRSDLAEISWQPAPEPLCREHKYCDHWPHSTCKARENRCFCDSKYTWNASTLSCTQEESLTNRSALILIAILGGLAILACTIIAFVIVRRKKRAHKLDKASTQVQESLYDSERHVKGLIGLGSLEEKNIDGIEVPCYTFASIVAATDNFSDSNKLGRGGYGHVYKGRFPGGQDIAVKRLSSVSTQGLQEFKNEVVLIAKLQHRNLVRLRGYCIKGDEKILLYEYMPNKSLDSFIFDRTRTFLLDWPMRFDIIVGIARGLLYLHQDSRLRVIHRDFKTSNILLDEEMNPKISDFGLAKIFGGKETEASTERVVGTYGYMAPEYALDGFFSIKSDVFGYGVVLLEILSGKRNTGFYESKQISSLLGYAWRLWTENKLLDLMDPSLSESCNESQFSRCALIGLLCVQDEPGDRPTMFNILTMLDSDIGTIPIPTQPTFFVNKRLSSSASSSSKPESGLQFESSYHEGR
ncbi:hypothetical protein RJT34_28843 [Clitoria ternatea]|uniref:non-specific serine/threonine protein kinase n=1 Tax=Clitoria ternatea TaxID=43366 RepID=A0AAN9F9U6_CLITE